MQTKTETIGINYIFQAYQEYTPQKQTHHKIKSIQTVIY